MHWWLLKRRFNNLFRALQYRDYRLFFFAQGISLIGTWMQSVATNWLVYRLSQSSWYLGIVNFSGQLPVLLLSPFAGVYNDRWNRRGAFVVIQWLAFMQALMLAFLTISGNAMIWSIVVLTFFLGIVNAFEMPTRQSLVVELVGNKNELANAIALNSTIFNGARLIGPAIAGVIVARYGEGICFLTNAATYMAAIMLFKMISESHISLNKNKKTNIIDDLQEGFVYVVRCAPIRDLLLLIILLSFVGMSFPVVLPVFATKILCGGSREYGALVAASGFGAFVATLYLATRHSVLGLGRVVSIGLFLFSLSLIVLAFVRVFPIALVVIAVAGGSMILNMAACNTIIQTIVDDNMRGRVMSMYVMAFMGSAPLGSLFAGYMANEFSAPLVVFIGGMCMLGGGIIFAKRLPAIRKSIHPIYRQRGIYPIGNLSTEATIELGKAPE